MQIEKLTFKNSQWNTHSLCIVDKKEVDLVFIFGDTDEIQNPQHFYYLKELYPNAHIIGSSSSGNIMNAEVSECSLVVSAIKFDSSHVTLSSLSFKNNDDLYEVSKKLVDSFEENNLQSILIISDGLNMNGSILAKGVNASKQNTLITGGLAGDGARFEKTLVIANDVAKTNTIAAIAFYGEKLHISSGCFAGWNEFGAQRIITKSVGNVVYEIDNSPALELYKKYLGEEAQNLPSSGLRFPLSIKKDEQDESVIRTLLAVDEDTNSLTFAGDVPEGSLAKLMKTDINGLIDGSQTAAKSIKVHNDKEALGLVVSCVGRKLVMNQLTDEELEIIEETLGTNLNLIGFYSYGELAPFSNQSLSCQLHNQTMTLTAIYED